MYSFSVKVGLQQEFKGYVWLFLNGHTFSFVQQEGPKGSDGNCIGHIALRTKLLQQNDKVCIGCGGDFFSLNNDKTTLFEGILISASD